MSTLEGCVRWRGQSAVYTSAERLIMADLPVREQAFVHALKATIDGEVSNWTESVGSPGPLTSRASGPALTPDEAKAETPTGVAWSHPSRGITGDLGGPLSESSVYTDPEDLEFGRSDSPNRWRSEIDRPKRRPKIYALVCTWKQSCVVPTKREGEFWMKVWNAWYERQGWKVKTHDTGYFAVRPASDATLREGEGVAKGTERHAIGLDEYDRETKERLK